MNGLTAEKSQSQSIWHAKCYSMINTAIMRTVLVFVCFFILKGLLHNTFACIVFVLYKCKMVLLWIVYKLIKFPVLLFTLFLQPWRPIYFNLGQKLFVSKTVAMYIVLEIPFEGIFQQVYFFNWYWCTFKIQFILIGWMQRKIGWMNFHQSVCVHTLDWYT